MQQADLSPARQAPATPRSLDRIKQDWAGLQTAIYGSFREPDVFTLTQEAVLDANWLNRATVTQRTYNVSHGATPTAFEIILITPNTAPDAPVIITQNFSSNRSVVSADGSSPLPGKARKMGPLGPVFKYFFGRYIVAHPYEDLLDRGYAVAVMHPPDYVPDSAKRGVARLETFQTGERPSALNIWASLSTALAAQLKTAQPNRAVIVYGHSRYGKTALLAAAHSPSIDGVIAHQSGTAGASLMRDKTGESLGDIVKSYPHWLSPGAADYADNPQSLPYDADVLLRAIAPKPVLLGNARRDVWSDPEGAFHSAKRAAAAYPLPVMQGERLDDFRPEDALAFWIRPGTHGVVKEDWPAFLDFLDAHFK